MRILVTAKEYKARAIYNEEGYVNIFISSYGNIQTISVGVLLRDYKHTNGKEIQADGLRGHTTIDIQRKTSEVMIAEFVGNQWRIRDIGGSIIVLGVDVFPLMYKIKTGDSVIPQVFKKTAIGDMAVTYITKAGVYRDRVFCEVSGENISYYVGELKLVTKKVSGRYKNDWNMAKGVMKAMEELVWDESIQIVKFEGL